MWFFFSPTEILQSLQCETEVIWWYGGSRYVTKIPIFPAKSWIFSPQFSRRWNVLDSKFGPAKYQKFKLTVSWKVPEKENSLMLAVSEYNVDCHVQCSGWWPVKKMLSVQLIVYEQHVLYTDKVVYGFGWLPAFMQKCGHTVCSLQHARLLSPLCVQLFLFMIL